MSIEIIERGQRGEAWFSQCRRYRYLLTRGDLKGDPTKMVTFVMLNPSTATQDDDDPTIRKCQRFTEIWGCGHLIVVNLYALRATDPDDMFRTTSPIGGSRNDDVIAMACRMATIAVCAWGADKRSNGRAGEVARMLRSQGIKVHRIGDPSKDGHPRHPLYLKYQSELQVIGGEACTATAEATGAG